MIPKEIIKKIRQIEISTSRLVTDVFAGAYHSVFKGRGIEFDEVREYQIGDDIRSIDWNVTARIGKPHIKKYVEERELTVMLMVDMSASSHFGTVNQLKSALAAEVAAVLAFSAIKNNDKVGLIIFTDKIEKFIPPRKGPKHVLRVIREALYFKPTGRATDISLALDYLNKVTRRQSVSFVISDFMQLDKTQNDFSYDFKKALAIANKKHDLIAITLNDPREFNLPECGIIYFEDAETGARFNFDSSNRVMRERFRQDSLNRLQKRDSMFKSVGLDQIDISTDIPYANSLVRFFKKRRKKYR